MSRPCLTQSLSVFPTVSNVIFIGRLNRSTNIVNIFHLEWLENCSIFVLEFQAEPL